MAKPTSAIESLPTIRQVIETHGLSAKKSLGQNFLSDLNITRKIVKQSENLEDAIIVEIGAGPGALTRAIMETPARKIILIEKDQRCIDALQMLVALDPRIEIHNQDALSIDWAEMAKEHGQKLHIMANLPYNISTVLLLQWLENIDHIAQMVLMFQREVADRITALPDNKAYGRLSVMAQWKSQPRQMFHLPPHVFWPPPKIESTIVRFKPKAMNNDETVPFTTMETIVKAAFAQRRKMIRASLKPLGFNVENIENLGIDPQKRADSLSLQDYLLLAKSISD